MQDNNANSIYKGILSLSLAALFTKILGVLYKIPLSYILGDEGMGYFNVAYTVFGFFYILSVAGVPKAITIAFSDKYNIQNDYSGTVFIISKFARLGFILTSLFIILSKPLSTLLGTRDSIWSMIAIAPSIFFIMISGVFRGLLTARSNLFPIAISQIIESISKLLFGLFFALIGVKLNMSLEIIASFTILGITLGSILSCFYLFKIYTRCADKKKKGISDHNSQKLIIKDILSKALPLTLSSSILGLTNIIDLGCIIRGLRRVGYSDTAATSIYGNYSTLALPMLNLVIALITPISVAVLPKLVKSKGTKNSLEYRDTLSSSVFITNFIAAPIMLSFLLYPFDLLDILYESPSSALGYESLMLLAPSMLLLPLLTIINTTLESIGKIKSTIISLTAGAVVKIFSTFILIRSTPLEILSVPISTMISYAVSITISLSILKKVGIKPLSFKNTFLPIFTASIIFTSVHLLFLINFLKIDSKLYAIILITLSILIYTGIYVIAKLTKKCLSIHKKQCKI